MGTQNVIDVVKGMDIPKHKKDEILNFLVVERPYPIGYLPDYIQISFAIVMAFSREGS